MMPQKDGLVLLADIRASPELEQVPVIMMTGVSEQDVVAKAIQLGVTDFMVKPFYPPRLLERVQKYLPLPDPSAAPGDESAHGADNKVPLSGTAPGSPPEI